MLIYQWGQYLVYWLKKGIGWVTFPAPYPKILASQYVTYDFAYSIANIWNIPAIFVFCRVFGVMYNMQKLFDGNTVLFYRPMDQTLKICVKEMWQKCVSLVCIDRWKSDVDAFLELNTGISMTHRQSANWKIGPLLSLQVGLNFTLAQGLYE